MYTTPYHRGLLGKQRNIIQYDPIFGSDRRNRPYYCIFESLMFEKSNKDLLCSVLSANFKVQMTLHEGYFVTCWVMSNYNLSVLILTS